MEGMDFSDLEAKVDELVALCDALVQENKTLRNEQQAWHAERAHLVERNDQSKVKLDTMIDRLKNLDEAF